MEESNWLNIFISMTFYSLPTWVKYYVTYFRFFNFFVRKFIYFACFKPYSAIIFDPFLFKSLVIFECSIVWKFVGWFPYLKKSFKHPFINIFLTEFSKILKQNYWTKIPVSAKCKLYPTYKSRMQREVKINCNPFS